jgi:hypothetical protein
MSSTFFKLISLAAMTLSMMIAMYGTAAAQTAPRSSSNIRGRIEAKAITVVDVKGEAVQRNYSGSEWMTLNGEATRNVVSDLQQKAARQRVSAQTAVIGANLTGATGNDVITQAAEVQLNVDSDRMIDISTMIEKGE